MTAITNTEAATILLRLRDRDDQLTGIEERALTHAIAVLETPTPSRDKLIEAMRASTENRSLSVACIRHADAVLALLSHPGEPE